MSGNDQALLKQMGNKIKHLLGLVYAAMEKFKWVKIIVELRRRNKSKN